MKVQQIREVVEATIKRLPQDKLQGLKDSVRHSSPPDLVTAERMMLRELRLSEAEVRASPVALERILGTNDLLDVNYLHRAVRAARAICRVILRDRTGRETGYGTGFKVSPSLMMTNNHVLQDEGEAERCLVEFDFELDESGLPRMTTRFRLDPERLFLTDLELDFSLVAIAEEPIFGNRRLEEFGFLRLVRDVGKINPGEFMTIIQHPSGQPKQVALRENRLLEIDELVLWYESDTAHGSSGAPVLNDSWQMVALHHSGVPRRDEAGKWLLKNGLRAGPDADDSEIDWIANEGIRVSRIVRFVEDANPNHPAALEFLHAASRIDSETAGSGGVAASLRSTSPHRDYDIAVTGGGALITIPLIFRVQLDGLPQARKPVPREASLDVDAVEKLKLPIVDTNYQNRTGYNKDFIGVEVPLPDVRDLNRVSRMDDGRHVIPYEHFSIVIDKYRRLAVFTASNIDASSEKKEPEPGKDYSRDGLGGFGANDHEMWLTDPRIPAQHQLPDRFYTRDGGAFDKGHLVRRDDVTWGDSYAQVRRANGDTYHTTNCSPQVAKFNRSNLRGDWGKLENEIMRQARTERYCLLSGPVLAEEDRLFVGRDMLGEVRIQIPSAYWKIVVAREDDNLEAFAFLLRQYLGEVPLEFAVKRYWEAFMISIGDLEAKLDNLKFPEAICEADQFGSTRAENLLASAELKGLELWSQDGSV